MTDLIPGIVKPADRPQPAETPMNYAPIKMGGFKEQPYLNW